MDDPGSALRNVARACAALALAMSASAAMAGGGHGGGGGGDSSMNPYTGDSYAYFHGGHNLGEQGTIRPGGIPPATGWSLWPWRATRNDAPRSAPADAPTGRFAPAPDAPPATSSAAPSR